MYLYILQSACTLMYIYTGEYTHADTIADACKHNYKCTQHPHARGFSTTDVCICIYIHIYIYIYIYIFIHVYTHVFICMLIHIYVEDVFTNIDTCINTCICIYIYVCVHIPIKKMCVYSAKKTLPLGTYCNTNILPHAHTYTHTHAHTNLLQHVCAHTHI